MLYLSNLFKPVENVVYHILLLHAYDIYTYITDNVYASLLQKCSQ